MHGAFAPCAPAPPRRARGGGPCYPWNLGYNRQTPASARLDSSRVCSDQHASKGASQGQQAESVALPSRKGKQEGAVHEQSGAKSSLSAGLIGLELTVREGQVHVSDVLAVAEGKISKGDRILEIASQPVGQVCPLPTRWLRVLL